MNETVQRLLELQELSITLREAEIVHGTQGQAGATDPLRRRQSELRQQVSPEYLSRFDRLRASGLAVVRVQNGICLGCNIAIARGDLNRIQAGKLESICPHCGKFLAVTD